MRNWMRDNRAVVAFALCIGAVLGLCLSFSGVAAVQTGSWGLNFQTQGQTPVGTVSQTVLDAYDAAYVGEETEKVLYLTFDAGYENGFTPQILDVLKQHQAPAAFFLVGNYLETEPELVCRMVQEGHTVGNHTWSHPDMSAISDRQAFEEELGKVERKYLEITGKPMEKFYRPPQGTYSEGNLEMAKELGYKTVFWSLAYADWNNDAQPTVEEAFSKLLPRVHPGAVVLLHATSKTNAAILSELLTKWEEMGYTFAPLAALFEKQ